MVSWCTLVFVGLSERLTCYGYADFIPHYCHSSNIWSLFIQGIHMTDLVLETVKFLLAISIPFCETLLQLVIISSAGVSFHSTITF